MIIIAEKINGSIPSMAKAIQEHNDDWIKDVAAKQDAVLSDDDFIDCAVGFEDTCAIPKKDLNVTDSNGNTKYKIYFYNGKKH